ncbi:hypothetical protein [Nevskia sp.]|uniref:hypothetical protein n=1 Tax=Nevskia sp. TaxID=1929292 RepID=UPI0025E21F2E|nr:hypothetical protein [Nevskia sp.]
MSSKTVFVAAAAMALTTVMGAASAKQPYTLIEPTAFATQHPAEIAFWSMPLDKTFDQFSSSEMELFRSQYADLRAHEEPPFPMGGLKSIVNELKTAQNRHFIHGEMFAVVNVDASGNAQSVSYLLTPDQGHFADVEAIIKRAKFKPAKCGGTACAMEFPLHVDFRIDASKSQF